MPPGNVRDKKEKKEEENNGDEVEYLVDDDDLDDRIDGSSGSRLQRFKSQFSLRLFRRPSSFYSGRHPHGFMIRPDNRWYKLWTNFVLIWALYSSFFTPMEFGFFRGLPGKLFLLDVVGQAAFMVDIIVNFFVAYRDHDTYRMIYSRKSIGLRYLKSTFIFDIMSCMPWDTIYKACGRKEVVRYLLWIRLTRVLRVTDFFKSLEKDIRISYYFTRIIKLLAVELYCTHTAACIFYYLATTVPESREGYTWIGSLQLGDFSYSNFREIDLGKRYCTSLYFATVTMATVGSKTERFRDKMKEVIKYMNRNKLGRDIRDQIKGHLRLQHESSYTEASVLEDIPVSIRSKISQTLYKQYIENVNLLKGCSAEFIQQIVVRLKEEFFLPGEVILEQGTAVDQLYFVCHGMLEAIGIGEDGVEETILQFEPKNTFGEISIFCSIPQPYTVRACELSRVLRLEKQSLSNILEIYFVDGRTILTNLSEGSEAASKIKQLESDIIFHIGKQEGELALRMNCAAYYGDLYQLKSLIRAGADPQKTDYDGRGPLHLAATKGNEDIVCFLISEGVNINAIDKFGNTPLLEAVKEAHERVASVLFSQGAILNLKNAGSRLCTAVAHGHTDFVRRLIKYGADPNSKDYDHRTPLHIASAEGLYLIAKLLIDAGASVFATDRWGTTPIDESRKCGSKSLMFLLENAKTDELSKFPSRADEIQDKMHPRRCSVFPFHPWDPKEKRKEGVVLWIPRTIEDLVNFSKEQLNCSGSRLLSEDGARIVDVDMISDKQKLYLIAGTETSQ